MTVEIRETTFDPWQTISHYQDNVLGHAGLYGATTVFVGTMREFNEEVTVQAMKLEHYPAMTVKYLEKISSQARQRWDILDTLIIHRVGNLQPNDPIVLLAVWAAHRTASFEACRFLIEELKSRAPFWKKETLLDGERWVSGNKEKDT